MSAAGLQLQDAGTFAFYWRTAIKPYPRQVATVLLLALTGATLDAGTVGLTVPLLDVLTAPEHSRSNRVVGVAGSALRSLGFEPSINAVIFTIMLMASLLFMIRSAFFLLDQYVTAAVAVRLRRSTRKALFERFLNARYEAMSARSRGTVINDINVPAESITGAITQLSHFVTGILNAALMVGLLLCLSWWATLLIGALAVGAVQGWRWIADRRSAAHGKALYNLRGEQNKLQVDAIDGLKVVKAHGLEDRMVERQDALQAAEFRPELQLVLFRHGPSLVNEVIAIAIVLGLGAVTFLAPSLGIRFSMLAAFLLAIRRIAPSLAGINQASVNLARYQRDLEVISEVLEALPQEPRGGGTIGQVEEIRLQEVSFTYASRPEQPVLSSVTTAMRRGTVTALVGATGSGKSTIVNILLGLYEPRTGAVRVNGIDLRELDLAAWRRHIGYVSQDVFVFNTTIRENIALGDERVTNEQVQWAAAVAQLHEFIVSLPDAYYTVVGDRGLRLSGGQCQRLAIARAVLKRPQVLIFDEATSALDNLTERAVYDAIRVLHQEAVSLVVAHRLGTIKQADQILVLEAGRLVEAGTHQELMSHKGVYTALTGERAVAAETMESV